MLRHSSRAPAPGMGLQGRAGGRVVFRFWLSLVGLLAAAAALLVAGPILLDRTGYSVPPVEVFVNGQTLGEEEWVTIEGTVLRVRIALPRPTAGLSAVLSRDGIPIEEIQDIPGSGVAFGPVLLPFGDSQITIEVRRRIWPTGRPDRSGDAFWPIDRSSTYVFSLSARPRTNRAPSISAPSVVWSHELPVSIAATPFARATLFLNGVRAEVRRVEPDGTVEAFADGTLRVDEDGTLDVILPLARSGDHRIRVVTEADSSTARRESEVALVRFQSELPRVFSRRLAVTIAPNRFQWLMEARLDQSDPRLAALLDGSASVETFAYAIHGRILFNARYYSEPGLRDLRLSRSAGKVQVSFRSRNFGLDPTVKGEIAVWREGGAAVPEADDVVEVAAAGRQFLGFVPAPQSIVDNVARWTADRLPEAGIVVRLSATPRQVSFWKLKPEQMVPRQYVAWAYDLLELIPILWLSYLMRSSGLGLDLAARRRLRNDLSLLGALVIFQDVYSLMQRLFGASVPILDSEAPAALPTIYDLGAQPAIGFVLFLVLIGLVSVAAALLLRGTASRVFSDLRPFLLVAAVAVRFLARSNNCRSV